MVSPKRQSLVFYFMFCSATGWEVSGNPNRDLLVVPSTKKVAVEADSAKLFRPTSPLSGFG